MASASRRRSPPERTADGLRLLVPAGEEEAAEEVLRRLARQPGGALDAVEHGPALVQLQLLLREVSGLDAVPEPHRAGGCIPTAEHGLEQRRLPRAVGPDESDMLFTLEREVDPVEQLLLARLDLQSGRLDDRPAAPGGLQEVEAH